jgi:DHA1 family bicyclomycin/chloramphenicol resistance-like MFS transporter
MKYKVFLLVLLGMLTAFGPFVTDMYVPSLPVMVDYFHTSISLVQLGLTTSMLGLAIGQLIFGPLSDKYGRRPPLLVAMIAFVVSSFAIIFSPTIEIFVILRFFQGFSGAGGIVISRSVATDNFEGRELLKMLAIIGAINGIAPIAAPVIGGTLVSSVGWRGIFIVLLVLGVLLLAGSKYMRESLPVERRNKASLLATFKLFGVVVKNRKFMLYVLQQGGAMAILFGNIGSSPFIVQDHYHFSPLIYSLSFAINGLALGLGSGLSVKFKKATTCVKVSCMGMLTFSALEAVVLFADLGFWAYEAVLCLLLFFMGFTFTAATTLALESERAEAGTASAIFGAVGFLAGGIVSPLVGFGNMLHSTAIVFLCGAILSTLFAATAMRGDKAMAN